VFLNRITTSPADVKKAAALYAPAAHVDVVKA
jgi:hypothetical protein